jgi:hypothetical protein
MGLVGGRSIALIEHLLELLFGIAVESNELEPEPITLFPSDDGKGDHDQWPRAGRLHVETEPCPDGKLDMTFYLAAGNRQIHQHAMP